MPLRFGYKAEEIVGKPITLLLPPDRLFEEDEIMARLHQGKPDELLDTVRVTKDGRRINVSVRVTPILDFEGRVIGASKVVRDISEHKRLEEEIRRRNASLEGRVAERTEELRKTIAELERFTYTVAHDLRVSLRGIHRHGELLLENGHELAEAEAQSHLCSVATSAKRMDQLIRLLMLLPVGNVLALAIMSHRARIVLKNAGLRVGAMGVSASDLPASDKVA